MRNMAVIVLNGLKANQANQLLIRDALFPTCFYYLQNMAACAKSDVSGAIYGKVTSLLDGYTKNAFHYIKVFRSICIESYSLKEPE